MKTLPPADDRKFKADQKRKKIIRSAHIQLVPRISESTAMHTYESRRRVR